MQSTSTRFAPPANPGNTTGQDQYNLFEVWGDTIDARHLSWSIAIGAVISVGSYTLAKWSLVQLLGDTQMVHAYAMLGGIVGCLTGGVVSALLFKPKRTVIQEMVDKQFQAEVIADLKKQYGSLGRVEEASPQVILELKELGLYEMFAQAQDGHEEQTAGAAMNLVIAGGKSGG